MDVGEHLDHDRLLGYILARVDLPGRPCVGDGELVEEGAGTYSLDVVPELISILCAGSACTQF